MPGQGQALSLLYNDAPHSYHLPLYATAVSESVFGTMLNVLVTG